MNITQEDLRKYLYESFDAGYQFPLEMMEQNINVIFKKLKDSNNSNLSSDINSWGWGDYLVALTKPDPWVEKTDDVH